MIINRNKEKSQNSQQILRTEYNITIYNLMILNKKLSKKPKTISQRIANNYQTDGT